LGRAHTHLNELAEIIEQFRKDNAEPITFEHNPDVPADVAANIASQNPGKDVIVPLSFDVKDIPFPSGIRSVIGDVVQNLRIPLNYLTRELAYLDSGSVQTRTQFPTFSKQEGFRGKESEYLRGVNPAHRHAIEGLQPYNGGDWLALLRDLSNPDKHDALLTIANQARAWGDGLTMPAPGGEGFVAHFDLYLVPYISIQGGKPVVEALSEIEANVRATIDGFGPCFQGSCSHAAP